MLYRLLRHIENKQAVRRAILGGAKIGKGCRFLGSHEFGSEPYLIEIKENVTVSSNVTFINHDGGTAVIKRLDPKKYSHVIKYGRIVIEENCFIGSGSIIMPNTHIGANTVIGAGSVVVGNIPANSVAVGVPAKVVKSIQDYAEKCLKETPNYSLEEYNAHKKATVQKLY